MQVADGPSAPSAEVFRIKKVQFWESGVKSFLKDLVFEVLELSLFRKRDFFAFAKLLNTIFVNKNPQNLRPNIWKKPKTVADGSLHTFQTLQAINSKAFMTFSKFFGHFFQNTQCFTFNSVINSQLWYKHNILICFIKDSY